MKVAHIIRRLTINEWGGTENVVSHSVRELARQGIDSEVLATRALAPAREELVGGMRVKRFDYFYPYWPLSAARRAALDKKGGSPFCFAMERYLARQPFDLIHSHNLGRLGELAARAAARRNLPLVYSLHGGCAEVPEAELREMLLPLRHTIAYGGILERLFRLRRNFIEHADGVICVGANECAALQARYPGKLVRYLPNGVDPEKFQQPTAFDWRRHLHLAPQCPILLNVSRIDYQKNQRLLLEFCALLREQKRDCHLLLIGPISAQWYAEKIQEDIARLQLNDRVTLVPGLRPDDPKLLAAYRQAEVFVLPSRHEPFGIVALEAWSAGLPVIAAAVGGLKHLVRDNVTGLQFESDDLRGLLAAYDRLPAQRDALIQAARAEVEARYTWRRVGEELTAFYREAADVHRR